MMEIVMVWYFFFIGTSTPVIVGPFENEIACNTIRSTYSAHVVSRCWRGPLPAAAKYVPHSRPK